MGLGSSLKGIYYFFEDKWYDALDKIDEKVPVYKVIDPIDKVVPSFVLFLLLVLFIMVFLGYLIQFNSPYDVTFTTIDVKTNKSLPTVKLSGTINGDLFSKITDSEGITVLTVSGSTRNTYEMLGQMIFPSEEDVSAIISAEKTGYNKIKDQEVNLSSRNAQISLSPVPVSLSYPDSTIAELIDSGSGATIVDSTGMAEIVFKCNNKNISEKTVKDNDDGALDGEFTLNEPNCEFAAVGASAPGYEPLSGVSTPLPASKNSIALTAYPAGIGTAIAYVSEKNSSPKKMLSGIQITFTDSLGGIAGTARTDNGGVASGTLLPGTYGVIASSIDGTYSSINADENKVIIVSAGVSSSIELAMTKVDSSTIRFIKIKVLESSDNNTPISGAKVFVQSVTTDANGTYVNGAAPEYRNCIPNASCLTNSDGMVAVNMNVINDGKRVVSIYKEGYVYKFIKPTFFKVSEGPEIVYLEKATSSNCGSAGVNVKSKSDQKALFGASTFLYFDSSSLGINKIKLRQDAVITNSAGSSVFTNLPVGTYSASAAFTGITSGYSATKNIDMNQRVYFDVNIDLNASFVRVQLISYNGSPILNVNTASVKLYSNSGNFSSIPSTPTEILAYQSGSFVSSSYERTSHLLITVDLNGYASNFLEIGGSMPPLVMGSNDFNIRLYPVSILDKNVNVFFNGLYADNTDAIKGKKFSGILDKNGTYYTKIDVIINKDLAYSDLFGSLIVNDKALITNFPFWTPLFYKQSRVYASALSEQIPLNPDSFYIRDSTAGQGRQAGIQWQGVLRKGTYNFISKFSMSNAKNGDFLELSFNGKEKHPSVASEDKGRISFKVGAPICDSSIDASCPKLFFYVTMNDKDVNSTNYSFNSTTKKFTDNSNVKINRDLGNTLGISLYNNSATNMTDVNVNVYSYSGAVESFIPSALSDKIKFDSMTGASSKAILTKTTLNSFAQNSAPITNLYSSGYNTTAYLVVEAQTKDGTYLLFINTKSTARELRLVGSRFLAGVMNQNFDGEVFGLPGNVPAALDEVSLQPKRNCYTTTPTNATNKISANINGNYFNKIVDGIYAYKKDCLDIDIVPSDTNYTDFHITLLAGPGDIQDQSLACVKAYFPSTIGLEPKEANINWNTDVNLIIKSTCTFPVNLLIESGLEMTNRCTVTLNPYLTPAVTECNVIINGKNKGYSSTASFSDILGIFPVYVKARNASTAKKFSLAETVKVHISNPNECFAISKDVFKLYETNPQLGFTINNSCQYTQFGDYFIPKASSAFEGVDLNSFAPTYDYVSFESSLGNYNIYPVEGMTFVLKDLSGVTSNKTVNEMRQYCQKAKTMPVGFTYPQKPTEKNSSGKVYWTKPQFMPRAGTGSAEEYCQQGFFEGTPGTLLSQSLVPDYISSDEAITLMNGLNTTDWSTWFGNDSTKGFWLYDCDATSCKVLVRTQTGAFVDARAPITDSSHFVPLCGTYSLFNTAPTPEQCAGFSVTDASVNSINDDILAAKQKYCLYNKAILAGFQLGSTDNRGHVYWIARQFMPETGIGSAEEYCKKGFFEGMNGDLIRSGYIPTIISNEEIAKLMDAINTTPFPWLGVDLSKGFWTGNCESGSCLAELMGADGKFYEVRVPAVESTRFAPLCVTYAPFNTAPTPAECDSWVTCNTYDTGVTSSGAYNVCSLNPGVQLGKSADTNLLTLQISHVKANGSTPLNSDAVVLWVEGNLLKARFVGNDYANYSDGSIETGIIDMGVSGDQYGIINIVDYVKSR